MRGVTTECDGGRSSSRRLYRGEKEKQELARGGGEATTGGDEMRIGSRRQ